ncbi:MAG: SEC-C metal-binding domain-containing protein [Actinomycetota bacterium]|nr:SEC-C metal-binding domain-containing protein [Actinomycetota bacterium]
MDDALGDGELAGLLEAAPPDEHALLELAVDWPALEDARGRLAARTRVFVLTRDPLSWIAGRGTAWATANADGDTLELVVYVTLEALAQEEGPMAALARYAATAVGAGAQVEDLLVSGGHPALAASGTVPRLLDRLDDDQALAAPSVSVRSQGWEPVGLGAIQDLVQEAFGPVDLERALVRLSPVGPPDPDCAACRGERFGFPGDLESARPRLCPGHRSAAAAVTEERIACARRSNPAGWRAIGKASARINGLPEPAGAPVPPRSAPSTGRNDPCPCGSGRKYKRCCAG